MPRARSSAASASNAATSEGEHVTYTGRFRSDESSTTKPRACRRRNNRRARCNGSPYRISSLRTFGNRTPGPAVITASTRAGNTSSDRASSVKPSGYVTLGSAKPLWLT